LLLLSLMVGRLRVVGLQLWLFISHTCCRIIYFQKYVHHLCPVSSAGFRVV
jgi:hypothetical protein